MMNDAEAPKCDVPPAVSIRRGTCGFELQGSTCTSGIDEPQEKEWSNDLVILPVNDKDPVDEDKVPHSRLKNDLNRLINRVINVSLWRFWTTNVL